MKGYKRFSIYLSDDVVDEINKIVEFRNRRISLDNEDKKPRTIEEFIKGSTIQNLKWLKAEEISAGLDDLGKPYRLKNNFKEIVKRKGWTQKQLADATNIDPSNISITLSNRSQPSLDYFLRIWIALGCPPLNECLSRVKE